MSGTAGSSKGKQILMGSGLMGSDTAGWGGLIAPRLKAAQAKNILPWSSETTTRIVYFHLVTRLKLKIEAQHSLCTFASLHRFTPQKTPCPQEGRRRTLEQDFWQRHLPSQVKLFGRGPLGVAHGAWVLGRSGEGCCWVTACLCRGSDHAVSCFLQSCCCCHRSGTSWCSWDLTRSLQEAESSSRVAEHSGESPLPSPSSDSVNSRMRFEMNRLRPC